VAGVWGQFALKIWFGLLGLDGLGHLYHGWILQGSDYFFIVRRRGEMIGKWGKWVYILLIQ
jgi:hypothetical protein